MTDIEKRKRALRKEVGFLGRITSPADFTDTWHRRAAAMAKPRNVVSALAGGAALWVMVSVMGFSVVSRDRLERLAAVERIVPDAQLLDAADLRVRSAAAVRAVLFVDAAITGRAPEQGENSWYPRITGRPAPTVDPGREAVLLSLIDAISKQPLERHQDVVDQLVIWTAAKADREVVAILTFIAGLPAEIRTSLLQSNAQGLRQIVLWSKEREARGHDVRSLEAAVAGHRLELGDQAKVLQDQIRSMTREMEMRRDVSRACQRHIRDFNACASGR